MRSTSRIAVVTGGASGFGQATTRRFGRGGDFVVIADHDEQRDRTTLKAITNNGVNDAFVQLGVTIKEPVIAKADRVEKAPGPIGASLNSAGIIHNPESISPTAVS